MSTYLECQTCKHIFKLGKVSEKLYKLGNFSMDNFSCSMCQSKVLGQVSQKQYKKYKER